MFSLEGAPKDAPCAGSSKNNLNEWNPSNIQTWSMIVPAASSMKGGALTASSFVSSQCSPEASQYLPNGFVAELRALWWFWGLIWFTFVSKTKSDFFQRRSSSDDRVRHIFLLETPFTAKTLASTHLLPLQNLSADLYEREWSLIREIKRNSKSRTRRL